MYGTQNRHGLLLVARHDLVPPALERARPALLLEGAWPAGSRPEVCRSLDEAIDARLDWIDEEASRLADRLGQASCRPDHDDTDDALFGSINAAWLHALALRYYLVKLLRLVAYFSEIDPLEARQRVQLAVARRRDEDYAEVMAEICRLAGAWCHVQWIDRPNSLDRVLAPSSRWRRLAARLTRLLEPRAGSPLRRRVVLCGNPRRLDPICRQLLGRQCRVWWLYERLAIRSWAGWRMRGVGQLVCDAGRARANRLAAHVPDDLSCRGVNLARPVRRWLAGRLAAHGPRETRILEQIDAHFRRLRPDALVLDEDATPLARAAAALARRHGARSFVVQHGAPCCRFGFAPLAADRFFAWGRSTQRQLTVWGVPAERISAVGSPWHDRLFDRFRHSRRRRAGRGRVAAGGNPAPRILLVTTVPPRDERPDAAALHLTRQSYAEMLRAALAAVAVIPDARLVVKLHPRTPDDPILTAVLAGFPRLRARVVRGGRLETWVAWADCVLSCLSSAGVDATLAGVPVIQLLPAGCGDVLPHRPWGMFGSARDEEALWPLLMRALAGDRFPVLPPHTDAFADLDGQAAARIAEAVLAQGPAHAAAEPGADPAGGERLPALPGRAAPIVHTPLEGDVLAPGVPPGHALPNVQPLSEST